LTALAWESPAWEDSARKLLPRTQNGAARWSASGNVSLIVMMRNEARNFFAAPRKWWEIRLTRAAAIC
jgi:hypothetical protein